MRALLIVFFPFALCVCLFSQTQRKADAYFLIESLKDPALAPKTYILGPGDGVTVDLWGNVNATYNLVVSQDGTIFIPRSDGGKPQIVLDELPIVRSMDVVPSLGVIPAEGLTLLELKEETEKTVAKYFRGVKVRVSILSLRSFSVSIVGSVRFPGSYSVSPLCRLSNLIEIVGGITATGSYRNIEIKEIDGSTKIYDFYQFLYKGNMEHNPYIKADDIVKIPQAVMSVKIVGRVLKRGNYELKEGETIRDLIEIAGGLHSRGSLTRPIKIYNIKKPEEVFDVDAYKLLVEKDSLCNIELKPGDVITIPMDPFSVTVVGQVTKGGTFEYEPGADFYYYLGLAGGYGERANEGSIRITRWDGTRVKWNQGTEIKPGDTIVIGRSELKGWRDYLEVTLNAANLLFIVWTISTYK